MHSQIFSLPAGGMSKTNDAECCCPANTPSTDIAPSPPPPIIHHDLALRLRRLLSRQNISTDPSIALLMAPSLWPSQTTPTKNEISIQAKDLLRHPLIESLSVTEQDILDAAEQVGQHLLRVDREQQTLYPVMKAERNTLILRDIPNDSTEQQIITLISEAPTLPNGTSDVVEIRQERVADLPSTWFVTLTSPIIATETALWLRTNATFKGNELKVGVKSETAFQSFMARPYDGHAFSVEGAFIPNMMVRGNNRRGMEKFNVRGGNSRLYRGGRGGMFNGRGGRGGGGGGGRFCASESVRGRGSRGGRRGGGGGRRAEWNNRNGGAAAGTCDYREMMSPPAKMIQDSVTDPTDFPPLVESAKLSTVGYGAREFRRYSPETLRAIQCSMDVQR